LAGPPSSQNGGANSTPPEEFETYRDDLLELGQRLRDSPFRQAERKGRALIGGQDVSSALRDDWIFGRSIDRVSWARDDQSFGDLDDRLSLVAFGRGIAEGAPGPNTVPDSLYDQSFLVSRRIGRFAPGVFVNPAGDIVFFGQRSGDIGSRICVPLSGGGGC
jgi:hypothetical protein